MRQLTFKISSEVDASALLKILQSIKGVSDVSISENILDQQNSEKENNEEKKLKLIRELAGSVDPSIIDLSDEKTRYIMSK